MPTRSKLPRDLSRFAVSRHDGEAVAWPGVGKEFAGDSASERPRPPMTGTAEEWAAIREILGDGAVSQLVGVEPVTVALLADGQLLISAGVAERLNWLHSVLSDLAGAYDDFGVRRWFDRPRAQLNHQAPIQYLGGNWSPDHPSAIRVRTLAAAVSGGGSSS